MPAKDTYKIDEAVTNLVTRIDQLKEHASTVIDGVHKLEEYPDVTRFSFSRRDDRESSPYFRRGITLQDEYFFFDSMYYPQRMTQERIDNVLELFDSATARWNEAALPIRERNIAIIKHNKEQIEKVKKLMNAVGIPDSYVTYEYKTKRHKNKTRFVHTAGYLKDIERNIQTIDSYELLLRRIQEKRSSLVAYGRRLIEKEVIRKMSE